MKTKKELKYPIKYAIMPIEEQIDWYPGLNQLERKSEVVANIVSKCYVISLKKTFLSDGNCEILYEVVFPYVKGDNGIEVSPRSPIPEFNIYSQCVNSISVNQIFDSFEDASVVASKLNESILHHEMGRLCLLSNNKDIKANIERIKLKYQETMDRCKNFENYVKKETVDMEVTKSYRINLDDIMKKIDARPSEFYSKLAHALSIEEREYLKQVIENKSCINCTNGSCNVEYCEKVGFDEFGKPQGNNCLGWNNPELIGRQYVLKKQSEIIK